MNSNSVHLIATDPPFNKGRDFHATPDSLASGASFHDRWSWKDDVEQEWVDQITDDWPHVMNVIQGSRSSYGDDMGAFLCYMAVRLLAMRRVLRDDGSIYLHCDRTASHYLKELMDAIFGKKNFRNEIIWCYTQGGRPKKDFPNKHETIFRYSKSNKYTFNGSAIRIPYELVSDKSEDSFTKIDSDGRLYKEVYGTDRKKKYRYYKDEGKVPYDWWVDIPQVTGRASASNKTESTGYPTQKPLKLYERMILASSNKGDIILDPFAGCATTLVAAERQDRQWVGIDIWDKAHEVVVARLEKEGLLGNFKLGDINYTSDIPERTDDGDTAVPFLKTKKRIDEPRGKKMSRAEMLEFLLEQDVPVCQGCGREFDDKRYLQLDHNVPRSSAGINHISNRILLCGPCNNAKSDDLTLVGIRKYNRKNGYMVDESNLTR